MHRLFTSLLFMAAVGCADTGDEGFAVVTNLAAGEGCSFEVSRTATGLSRGTLSLYSPDPYLMIPLFESRISAIEGQASQRTISLRGARVSLEVVAAEIIEGETVTRLGPDDFAGLPAESLQFTTLFAGSLTPLGLAATPIDVVPPSLLAALRAAIPAHTTANVRIQVVATVRAYGELSGDEVESLPFVFPITICNDCVVNVLRDATTGGDAACPVTTDAELRLGNGCNPYQDGVVDCCVEGGALVCPAETAI